MRHEGVLSSTWPSGTFLSNENADGTWAVVGSVSAKRGRFPANVPLEGGGEEGGEGVGDGENKYLWLPGPILMGSAGEVMEVLVVMMMEKQFHPSIFLLTLP